MIHKNASCPMKLATKEINYPSMAVQVVAGESFVVSFPRSVTNVGRANSTYVARIEGDRSKLHVSVEPNTLQFTTVNQKMKFVLTLTVTGNKMKHSTPKRMSLVWTDVVHRVQSPIVIYKYNILWRRGDF
ncbi:putative cucumisin [Helianthus annuus]|uniref:Cucumisin n=1 Tax=Helianthus annuus TaxID=4232 RepID=A0A9K3HK01_HELAN|nr:putative cucumisin [Helianthus annuus]KAJ0490926.1 putative cucumisin [Helianthus annuus]KAJ0506831.1 putative cucumisin [Helianthus annuus]KAJ0864413.1 putative cucumisin [Helianthus annuus]KAJ0868335.1 putative cucumisin [Helianthus annuus]